MYAISAMKRGTDDNQGAEKEEKNSGPSRDCKHERICIIELPQEGSVSVWPRYTPVRYELCPRILGQWWDDPVKVFHLTRRELKICWDCRKVLSKMTLKLYPAAKRTTKKKIL